VRIHIVMGMGHVRVLILMGVGNGILCFMVGAVFYLLLWARVRRRGISCIEVGIVYETCEPMHFNGCGIWESDFMF